MQTEIDFPSNAVVKDLRSVLLHNEGTETSHYVDLNNLDDSLAIAHGVLVAPPAGKKAQKMLLLPKSNMLRSRARVSEGRSRANTIAFLQQEKAFENTGMGLIAIRPILFPSVSRCSSCISRTNTNGWREWVMGEDRKIGLEDAYELSLSSDFELFFYRYRSLPDDTIEVPFSV